MLLISLWWWFRVSKMATMMLRRLLSSFDEDSTEVQQRDMKSTGKHRFGNGFAMGAMTMILFYFLVALSHDNPNDEAQPFLRKAPSLSTLTDKEEGLINNEEDNDVASFLENVSYSQLIRAVTKVYEASNPVTTDARERFEDALEAMQLIEEDGIPAPIAGVDGLYVGGVGAAYNLQGLHQEGITHIVSLTPSGKCHFPGVHDCLHVNNIRDDTKSENNISQTFETTLPFIHNALTTGGRVLVHCWRGKSRSVSTIIAYMIKYHDCTPGVALATVKKTRPKANPNSAYWKELENYYQTQRHVNN